MRTGMTLHRFWFVAAALMLMGASARAEVITQLESNEAQVGRPIRLVYRFVNMPEPENMPRPAIAVDGLQIEFQGAGRQSSFSFSFGGGAPQNRSESSIEYTYVVLPLRPGDFTIPGFEVRSGNQVVRTQPARLRVHGGGGYAQPMPAAPNFPQGTLPPGQAFPTPPPHNQAPRQSRPYFGELLMPAKSAFVGEVVPVEIRFYFRGDTQLTELQPPTFSGDGFTAAPLGEPQQTTQEMDGVPYRVFIFRSAITPVKTGDIAIPPVTMNGRILVQDTTQGNDPLADFFGQFFNNMPMPGFGRAQQIEVETRGRTLKVLPLPKDGRPSGFSGAVGQFKLGASVNPATTGPGEPMTLSLEISGRGNFDVMSVPTLTGTDGWRTYAPKEKFLKDDAVGFAGTKTFEFKMIALRDQSETPGAEFSYFDPAKKEYVTLHAAPQRVQATGREASAADNPAPSPSSQGSATPAPKANTPPSPTEPPTEDIANPASALSVGAGHHFAPSLRSPWFLGANALLLALAVIGLPAVLLLRRHRRKTARRAARERGLRDAKAAMAQASSRADFYQAAAQFLLTRLDLPGMDASSDFSDALRKNVSGEAEQRDLQSILDRRDELKYGGEAGGSLSGEERTRVMALLEKFAARK